MTAQSDSEMSFAVLGPGGVGGLLGALLARQGNKVLCLSGEATAARLRESELTVRSERFGTFGVPVRVATELGEPVDACLITVKATNIDAAIERVPAAALGDALVVPFLNGIEHVARLRRSYPAEQVVPATIQVESSRTAPGEIEHSSPFASIALAAGSNDRGRVEHLAERLESAGLNVSLRDDETAMLWDKLSFLAPLALLTTHMNAPVGVVRTERRHDLLAVVHEVVTVAGKQGAEIDEAGVLARLDGVPDAMRSSMQRDATAGKDIEIEATAGQAARRAPLRLARSKAIQSTPVKVRRPRRRRRGRGAAGSTRVACRQQEVQNWGCRRWRSRRQRVREMCKEPSSVSATPALVTAEPTRAVAVGLLHVGGHSVATPPQPPPL